MNEVNGEVPANDAQPVRRMGRPKGSRNKPKLGDGSIMSPNGVKKLTSDLMKQRVSAEDSDRYIKLVNLIHEDIVIAKNALHRLADNLEIIKRDRLYYAGGYATFGDFCIAEIGSRQQAYRLLGAREVIEILLLAGFKEHELPDNENLCRAVKKLPVDAQAKVWKIVRRYAEEHGEDPTATDVVNAAAGLGIGGSKTDNNADNNDGDPTDNEDNSEEEEETKQRQQNSDKLIREWETVAHKLKVGLDRETLTPAVILRLAAVLTDIKPAQHDAAGHAEKGAGT